MTDCNSTKRPSIHVIQLQNSQSVRLEFLNMIYWNICPFHILIILHLLKIYRSSYSDFHRYIAFFTEAIHPTLFL